MTLQVRPWDDLDDDELLAEGNTWTTVTLRSTTLASQGIATPTTTEERVLIGGWYENPATRTLSLRRRVRIPDPVDEVILIEWRLLNADEWVSIVASGFLFDPEGMLEAKRQREEQADLMEQAAAAGRLAGGGMALPPGAGNRQQRRHPGR